MGLLLIDDVGAVDLTRSPSPGTASVESGKDEEGVCIGTGRFVVSHLVHVGVDVVVGHRVRQVVAVPDDVPVVLEACRGFEETELVVLAPEGAGGYVGQRCYKVFPYSGDEGVQVRGNVVISGGGNDVPAFVFRVLIGHSIFLLRIDVFAVFGTDKGLGGRTLEGGGYLFLFQ